MKKLMLALIGVMVLVGCVSPGEKMQTYSPVAMRDGEAVSNASNSQYLADLHECRQLAASKADEYHQREVEEAMTGAIVGAIASAMVADSYGTDRSRAAGRGALLGGAGAYDPKEAQTSANRIVDRCLAAKGYDVLSDFGQG